MEELYLRDYRPVSQLVVPQTTVSRPRFPIIDAHNHLAEPFGGGWDKRPLAELLERLDQAHVTTYVDLDGGWGEDILQRHLDYFKQGAPDRFLIFGGVDWERWAEYGDRFGAWAAGRLEEQVRWGAQGLKIWKPLGLHVKDQHGRLVAVDDARLDPIWQTAAELDIPVLIHVADPVAFFLPLDANNERWEELQAHPDWQFPSPPFPSFQTIMEQLAGLVANHPATTFIGAHVGCYAENLPWVADMLERYPNFYIDISARISELGRQPYTARSFFLTYSDRILFGTDAGPSLEAYRTYIRFLETKDEYFSYDSQPVPGQGRWAIYGLFLPDDVLEKVYRQNARRVLHLEKGGSE
ncbi:MAG: amidohydrolase family protein [Candidatus Promineifilaceae bacterium]